MMNKRTLPVIGILAVTVLLLVLNHFTEMTFIKDYAYLFIIAGMLLGVWLSKLASSSKDNK